MVASDSDDEKKQERRPLLRDHEKLPFIGEHPTRHKVKHSLWQRHKDEESPDFFDRLTISEDGGLSEVKLIGSRNGFTVRYITAAMTIFFAVYNSYTIITGDVRLLLSREGTQRGPIVTPLIINGVVNWVYRLLGRPDDFFLPGVKLLALAEVTVLVYLLGQLVYTFARIYSSKKEYNSWLWIAFLAWEVIPGLSVYSAFGLLYFITPTVFAMHLEAKYEDLMDDSGALVKSPLTALQMLVFLLSRLLCGVVGFDAFEFKFWQVADEMLAREVTVRHFLTIVVFLMQVLGVIRLSMFVRERVLSFIFAGADGMMQHQEQAALDIFNALLVRRIYREFSPPHRQVILLTFSDIDFQKLIISESEKGRPNHGKLPETAPPTLRGGSARGPAGGAEDGGGGLHHARSGL